MCSIDRSNTEMMLESAVEVVETNPHDISANDNRLDTSTTGQSNSTSYIALLVLQTFNTISALQPKLKSSVTQKNLCMVNKC